MCKQHLQRLEIDGLGTVINCVLFSFPSPCWRKQAIRQTGKNKHLILFRWIPHCLSPLCSTCLTDWGPSVAPGAKEVRDSEAARQCVFAGPA